MRDELAREDAGPPAAGKKDESERRARALAAPDVSQGHQRIMPHVGRSPPPPDGRPGGFPVLFWMFLDAQT